MALILKLPFMISDNQSISWIDKAIQTWTSSNIKLQKGVSSNRISEFEKLLDFEFPEDFIELYSKANGFENFDWNENMFSLWSLERIWDEYKFDDDNNYIGFCDFLINSHSIGFLKNEKGIFKSYDHVHSIAKTFKEGIELINLNSDLIY